MVLVLKRASHSCHVQTVGAAAFPVHSALQLPATYICEVYVITS